MPYKNVEDRRAYVNSRYQEFHQKRKGYFYDYNRKYSTRLSEKERRHLDQVTVLMHYSNPSGVPICNNCGEQNIEFLCLDHILGGGGKHAKERESPLYRWILKNEFPEGFQVLCANCNQRKMRMDRSRNGKLTKGG